MSDATMARNMKRVGHLDLPGGGQVTVDGNFAFVGHMKPPHGTTIVDVSDPANPRIAAEIPLQGHRSHTHKVRVAGDIMITNVEQNERHAARRAAQVGKTEAALATQLGRPATEDELCAELKLNPAQLRLARDFAAHPYEHGGFRVWDISDRTKPRLLSSVKTHGFGVHRFDMDARYAYISTEMDGFIGNILVIYDLGDPANPQEISRWWMPGQHLAGGEVPSWPGYRNRLHHALRQGNELWAAVWFAGMRVIDVSDISAPRTIGAYDYHPPFPEPTHTFLKVPFPVGGREIAVVADEEHEHTPGQLHAGLWTFDVTDRADIKPVGMFHLSERDSPFAGKGGRFGLHQFQEHMSDTRLYCTWFGGGLRVIDIADPALPIEVAHYIPEPCAGQQAPQTNDVDVDGRGLVHIIDRNLGFDILQLE